MKINHIILSIFLLASTSVFAEEKTASCQKKIMVKLYQTSYSLNIWKHVANQINSVEFELPVTCEFYDSVSVGDSLLKKNFRWGSLIVKGSMGTWNLEVSGK